MVFSHLFASESVVGVDIGSNTIKIVRAEPSKQGGRVTNIAMCSTPPECVKEGIVTDIPEVAAAVKACMRSAGIKVTNGIAAIAGPGVIVRQVQVPTMPERVLRKSIRFEASKYISTSIEDSLVEFEILGSGREEGQMNIMIASAPRAMVDSRVSVLEQSGLDPLAIDVEVFASLRSLVDYNSDKFLSESTVGLLDIGASHAEINLVSKGCLELSRTIPIAGDSFTNAIKNARGCSDADAELIKSQIDLTELVSMPAGAIEDPCMRALQSLIDELLREVRRSVNYYQSQLPEGTMDTVLETLLLSGGSTRLKGLGEYIHSRLHMDVRTANPILGKLVNQSLSDPISEEDVPLISVAFGLAVKEMNIALNVGVNAA